MELVNRCNVPLSLQMKEKASLALKAGRLMTAGHSSMCGADLQLEETYLITGRLIGGKARISLCSYIEPWKQLAMRQKKGFRLLYRQGCQCEVISCLMIIMSDGYAAL